MEYPKSGNMLIILHILPALWVSVVKEGYAG